MPVKKKFQISQCKDCVVFFPTHANAGECRLQPPAFINEYRSAYPLVKADNPACWCGVKGSKTIKKGNA
jgi:hypothetical protein